MEFTFTLADEIDPVAVYAAIVATAAFLWEFIKWWRSGPRLLMRASSDTQITGFAGYERDLFIMARATNIGSSTTTITHLTAIHWPSLLHKIAGRRVRRMIVFDAGFPGGGYQLPYVLEVGKDWVGLMRQTPEAESMAKTGRFYVEIGHSFARKPERVRVKMKKYV